MLTAYLLRTTQLLQNPAATSALYASSDLTDYINTARGQLAGETQCIRNYGSLTLAFQQQVYPFTSIVFNPSTGIAGAFVVRGATVGIGEGALWLAPRPFPWFQFYHLNNPVPVAARPREYSQFGQGETGSFFIAPTPDNAYTVNLDCVCVPSPLASDSDPEAIPYPWTDAVPYFAAYLAFASAQRASDADRMWQEYQKFTGRGVQMVSPAVNPQQSPYYNNPVRQNQLGVQPARGQQQQGGGG
jgi:hypothetical protein